MINGDNVVEDDEYFFVEIYGVDLGTFDPTPATIGIYNDDGALDYGDAPASYRTLIADNGPRHVTQPGDPSHQGYHLGQAIDTEADGQPTARANGDDISINDGDQDETAWNPLLLGAGRHGRNARHRLQARLSRRLGRFQPQRPIRRRGRQRRSP